MNKLNKELIKVIIDDLNGLSFKNSNRYLKQEKIFFLNRYFKILSLLPVINKNDVGLEIGLAGGVLAFVLRKQFNLKKLYTLEHPITAKQYTPKFLEKLKKENILLKSVDLKSNRLPWKDNSFNFVFFCDVIEHLIPSDVPVIMKEINRILKKGGFLIVITPNIASLLKRINLFRGKNPIEFDLNLHEGATYGHIREYTMAELEDTAKKANFKVESKRYFMIDVERNIFTRIEDLSSKFYSPLANSLAIVLKK